MAPINMRVCVSLTVVPSVFWGTSTKNRESIDTVKLVAVSGTLTIHDVNDGTATKSMLSKVNG